MMQCLVCEVRLLICSSTHPACPSRDGRERPVLDKAKATNRLHVFVPPTLASQDWFHSSHLNLTSPSAPPATATTPAPSSTNGALPPPATTSADIPATAESSTEDEVEGPPPVLTEDDYAHIVCERCVLAHPVLVDHLGSAGFMTIVKPPIDAPKVEWDVLGRVDATPGSVNEGPASAEGPAPDGAANPRKHPLPPHADDPSAAEDPPAKKVKLFDSEETTPSVHSTCTLAPHLPHLAALVASRQAAVPPDHGFGSGRADLFLPEDFRERWCRCENVRALILLSPAFWKRTLVGTDIHRLPLTMCSTCPNSKLCRTCSRRRRLGSQVCPLPSRPPPHRTDRR